MSTLCFLRVCEHRVEGLAHLELEPIVHFLLGPEVAVTVLDPLEVRGGDAAGVGQDVGHHEHAALVQRLWASGVVGPLAPSMTILALIEPCVVGGDLVLERGGHEDVHVEREQLVVGRAARRRGSRPPSCARRPTRSAPACRGPAGCGRRPSSRWRRRSSRPPRASAPRQIEPTLPNPCTATVAPFSSKPRCLADSRATIITPRPVASRRPSEPPISTGLPVTTAVAVWPTCIE